MRANLRPGNRLTGIAAAALAVVLIGTAPLGAADLKALVASMPDADREPDGKYTGPPPEKAEKAVRQVLDGGAASVLELVGMLEAPGKGADYKAHYLLHAVATYAAEPGRERHRTAVCMALFRGLAGNAPEGVKDHLLEELKWIGRDGSVEPVARFLTDEALGAQAADVLIAIGTDTAAAAIRGALPRATGRNRLYLIQGLGTLADREAAPALMRSLRAPDRLERIAAAVALAEIADPQAVDPVLKAAEADDVRERRLVTDAVLDLAANLQDRPAEATRVYETLLETRDEADEVHVRIAALRGLATVQGEKAMDRVFAAMGGDDVEMRAAARDIARSAAGGRVTQWWVNRLADAGPAAQAGILSMLASRGDPAALPAVVGAVDDPNATVRLAAIRAAGTLGDSDTVPPLVARLDAAAGDEKQDEEERQAVREALVRLEGAETSRAVARHIAPPAKPQTRAVLLDVLAARGASDQVEVAVRHVDADSVQVQVAAVRSLGALAAEEHLPLLVRLVKEAEHGEVSRAAEASLLEAGPRMRDAAVQAVAPVIEGAEPERAAALLRVLGEVGGRDALKAVVPFTRDSRAAVRDAAVRVLTNWRGSEAAQALLEVGRTTQDKSHHTLAVRQYVEIARREVRDDRRKLEMFEKAMKVARTADLKRRVLGAVGDSKTLDALRFAASYLDDREVVEEAAVVVVSIAGDKKMHEHRPHEAVESALKKVLEVSRNEQVRADAVSILGPRAPGDPLKGM